jgi:hypothetical protein
MRKRGDVSSRSKAQVALEALKGLEPIGVVTAEQKPPRIAAIEAPPKVSSECYRLRAKGWRYVLNGYFGGCRLNS